MDATQRFQCKTQFTAPLLVNSGKYDKIWRFYQQ